MSVALVHRKQQAVGGYPKQSNFGCQKGRDQGIQQQQYDSSSEAAAVVQPRQQQQQQQQCTAGPAVVQQCSEGILCRDCWPVSHHVQQARPEGLNDLSPPQQQQQQQQQQGDEAFDHCVSIPSLVQQLHLHNNKTQCDCDCHNAMLEQVARDLGNIASTGPDQQAAVIAAGAVPLLLQHLGSSSSMTVQGYCALALGKIASRNPNAQDLIGQLGGMQQLVQLLQDQNDMELTSDTDCNSPRSKAVGMLIPDTTHLVMGYVPDGGWLQVRGCAALAISSLAWHNAQNSAAVAAAGGIESLVQVIRDSSSSSDGSSSDAVEVVCRAVQALGSLHKEQAAAMAAAGGIKCLVQLLVGAAATTSSSSSCRMLDYVLKALLNLVHYQEALVHANLLTPDTLSTLVALACSSVEQQQPHPPAAAAAAAILAQLIQHSAENAAAVVVSGGLSHCVTLLHHTLSHNDSKASLINALSTHAAANNSNIRKNIVLALAYLGQYPDYRYRDRGNIYSGLAAAAVGTGLVKPLLLLLGDGDEEAQAAAAAALRRIIGTSSSNSSSSSSSTVLHQIVQIILESGGATAFVRLLRSSSSSCGPSNGSSSVCDHRDGSSPSGPARLVSADAGAAASVCSISSSSRGPARPTDADRAGLSGSGSSSNNLAQEWAAYTLTLLAQYSQQMQAAIFAAGALEPLTAMLHNAHLQHAAAQCVAALCLDNADVQSAVVSEGALPPLLSLLGPQCTSEAQSAAAAAIGNLVADNAALRATAAAAGGAAKPLIDLLTNVRSDLTVKSWAAYALAHLCKENADVQSAVLYSDHDVLHALVEMTKLKNDRSCTPQHNAPVCMLSNTMHCADAAAMNNAQLHAVCALANLADNAAMHAAIVQAGGLQALIGLLQRPSSSNTRSTTGSSMGGTGSSSSKVQEVAALALWEMARHDPGISRDIAAAGALAPLVDLLSAATAAAAEVAADAESVVSTCEAPRARASSSCGSSGSSTTKTSLADSLQQWASHVSLFITGQYDKAVGDLSAEQHLGQVGGISAAAAAPAATARADAGQQAAATAAADRQPDASHTYHSGVRSHPLHELVAQKANRPARYRHSISISSALSVGTAISHMQKHCHVKTHNHACNYSFPAAGSSRGWRVTAAARTSSSRNRQGKSSRTAVPAAPPRGIVPVHQKGRKWQAAPLTAVVRPPNTSREPLTVPS